MKQCRNCGKMNIDVYKYCSSCGSKLDNANQASNSNIGFNPPNAQPLQDPYQGLSPYQNSHIQNSANNTNQTNSNLKIDICQITFKRPNNVMYIGNVFRIYVDNVRYDLRNNSEITIKLPKGNHHVEISVIAIPKKKKFDFSAYEDMTFLCSPNAASAFTYFSAPVKVADQSGRVY